jgi:chromate transporter
MLPGPASSQLGIAIGTLRAGYLGGVLAWFGFTLPSAIAMTAFALLTSNVDLTSAGWVEGLKLAAVAVVAQAVVAMARALAPDIPRAAMAGAATVAMLVAPAPSLQVLVIAVGGLLGWRFLRGSASTPRASIATRMNARVGLGLLALYGLLLLVLPLSLRLVSTSFLAVVDAFYRAGALVFGGGHVVLPLLHEAVVTPGWISEDRFLAGYGAAQAVPGPLSTFAAYLGAGFSRAPNGVPGAVIALFAIFLPSFLLIWGALPLWDRLRDSARFAAALRGTNAAVVGILLAALVTPIATSALHEPVEAVLAGAGLLALWSGRVPPIAVVAAFALIAQVAGLK